MAKARVVIRRIEPGRWVVTRPSYGFSAPRSITAYNTWTDAMRSVLFVSLGGTGTFERNSTRSQGVTG